MPRRVRRLDSDDPLYELDQLVHAISRPKAIADSQASKTHDSSTSTSCLDGDVIVSAYKATCEIPRMLSDYSICKALRNRPSVITRRWVAIRYWILYCATALENSEKGRDKGSVICNQICQFLVALHDFDNIDDIWPPLRADTALHDVVTIIWIKQSQDILRFAISNPHPSRRRLTKWCKRYPPGPSQIFTYLFNGSTDEYELSLISQVRGDCDFLALSALERLRNVLRVRSPLAMYDIRAYVNLVCILHSSSSTPLRLALIGNKSPLLVAKALRQHMNFLLTTVDVKETKQFIPTVSVALQLFSHLISIQGRPFPDIIQQISRGDLFQTLMYIYILTQDEVAEYFQQFRSLADTLLQEDLPRHLNHYMSLNEVVKSFNRFEYAPLHYVQRFPAMSYIWRYAIERAILKAMFDRARFNEKYRCFSCNELFGSRKLKLCGQCKSVRYCSTSCQRNGWKTGGHSRKCPRVKAINEDRRTVIPMNSIVEDFLNFVSLMDSRHCFPGICESASRMHPTIPVHELVLHIDYAAQPLQFGKTKDTQVLNSPVFALRTKDVFPQGSPRRRMYEFMKTRNAPTVRAQMFVVGRLLADHKFMKITFPADLGPIGSLGNPERPRGPGFAERFIGKSRATCGVHRAPRYMFKDEKAPLTTVPWDEVDEVWARAVEKTKVRGRGRSVITIWDAIEEAVSEVEDETGFYRRRRQEQEPSDSDIPSPKFRRKPSEID